ncbi:PTS beta-glucoside transporter subunit IIABC [Furfurilactobacillus sp. OKN36]
MNLAEIDHAGKQKTVITAITNTDAVLDHLTVKPGTVTAGDVAADVTLKTAQQDSAAASTTKGESKYETLAKQIVQLVGGKANVNSVIHCITRVRFYLKDDHKADDEAIRNLDGVIDIAKSGGQYQVVIGPAVTEVYNGVIKVLGPEFSEDGDASVAAPKQVAPKGMWPATKFYFSQLIGVITGSMIPIIGLMAAAGILKGTLALATTFHWVSATSSTYVIVSAMGDSVFFFLPIFVGYTAARRLGADPIIVAIIGGVMTYPTIVKAAAQTSKSYFLGVNMNANLFGLPIHLVNYSYSIFPIIAAAYMAAKLEPWLKKHMPMALQMIFNPLIEVFAVSAVILIVVGPIISILSSGIAAGLMWLYNASPTVAGVIIGGFYQCLVIFGLHWAVIPIVANQIAADGSSQINALVSASMVAQGGAVLAILLKTKTASLRELAAGATISAFSGITEPAMYGINLKYGRAFITACIGGAAGGLITGLLRVNMWGFTGSLIGFTSFVNPKGLDASFWGYLLASATSLVVSFACTWAFGFKESDVANKKMGVKKVRLGNREPVAH